MHPIFSCSDEEWNWQWRWGQKGISSFRVESGYRTVDISCKLNVSVPFKT